MERQSNITVSDLGLSSLLLALQFQLVGLERVNEKRVNFIFTHAEGIDRVIGDFWADVEISVSVQSLFNCQKVLKNRLYAFK